MNPLIWKIIAIAIVGIIGFFGAQQVFKPTSQLSQSSTEVQIPANQTQGAPKQVQNTTGFAFNTTDVWGWIKTIPLKDFWDMLTAGVGGFVKWLTNGFNILLNYIFHAINPNISVPSWIGWLGVLAILGAILWWQFGNIWEFVHHIVFWVVMLILIIVIIAIFLIFIGILH